MSENPYIPQRAEILQIRQETSSETQDVKTYVLRPSAPINYMPGQFLEVSVPGVGEAPFGFASDPLVKDTLELSIKRTGAVTEAIHRLNTGDALWLRGPFGNTFPLESFKGRNLLYIAGGLGLGPLRPMIDFIFAPENRKSYGKIDMLVAARSTKDFLFAYDYKKWAGMPDTSLQMTIDRAEEGWSGLVGFPHVLVKDMELDLENTVAALCGPPIMIKALSGALAEMGLPLDRIYTTLEMRMTCGVGKCGKCNIGRRYVCVDGPVFSMAELSAMPNEY